MNMCLDWMSIAVHTSSVLAIIHSSQLVLLFQTLTTDVPSPRKNSAMST